MSAIAAHLALNVPVFTGTPTRGGGRLSLEDIKALVRTSRVVEFVCPPPGWAMPPHALDDAEALYVAGTATSVCSVVLSGTVTATFGVDSLSAPLGAWKVFAPGALTASAYVSDVTIMRTSDVVTALRIERADFAAVLAGGAAGLAGAAAARASAIAVPRLTRAGSVGGADSKHADVLMARNPSSFMGAAGALLTVTRDRDVRMEARRAHHGSISRLRADTNPHTGEPASAPIAAAVPPDTVVHVDGRDEHRRVSAAGTVV